MKTAEEIIARYRTWYQLAVEEKEGATYHVPILEAMPLIEALLAQLPAWDLTS